MQSLKRILEEGLLRKSFTELEQLSTIINRAQQKAFKRDRRKLMSRLKDRARKGDRVHFDISNPNLVYTLLRVTRDYVYLQRKGLEKVEYQIPITDVTEVRRKGHIVYSLSQELDRLGWPRNKAISRWFEIAHQKNVNKATTKGH